MYLRPILGGIKNKVLGPAKVRKHVGAGHSARYCYSVWLRHLVYLHRAGFRGIPDTVAELGPGDSLGVGLAALLTGSRRYYACDVERVAAGPWNLTLLDELVELLQHRAPIPDQSEFPLVNPVLDGYEFPSAVLSDAHLNGVLSPTRVAEIREALIKPDGSGPTEIRYQVPWVDREHIQGATVDVVISQAVLEHVDDLDSCYSAMAAWLKPGGYASHQVDFSSHDLAPEWNGHWSCSQRVWNLVRTGLPYLLNRAPCSEHEERMAKNGLTLATRIPRVRYDGLKRNQIRPEFQSFTDDDLITASAYLLARRSA
jgi:SAM-dependent methyltransferase